MSFFGKLFAWENSMKVAIPEFRGRVSPTWDFCRHLLIFDISGKELTETTKLDFSEMESNYKVWFLKELGVDILLCGGISSNLAEHIKENGIDVIPWVSGQVREVLDAYLTDRLSDPGFTSPGSHQVVKPSTENQEGSYVCPACGNRVIADKDSRSAETRCPDCGSVIPRR